MPSLSVFGAQWGDEGKGKIIDRLAAEADVVVRYQGGANAGHTVVVGDERYVLHLIPSGVLHEGPLNVIAGGCVIDPLTLFEELDGLAQRGVSVGPDRIRVSSRAHVIFSHHRRLDEVGERGLGEERIGTTGRGIGPCYADKAARRGLRIADLIDSERCRQQLERVLIDTNTVLTDIHGEEALDVEETLERYVTVGERLRPFVDDSERCLRQAYAQGKQVLFEGAQGAMLDLDLGTYPFVTSSNTGVAGIPGGAGFPPQWIDRALGIAKAYCTRVGQGPFPSEELGEVGDAIRAAGHEYGATTGRPRRCGWFDAVAVRHAFEVNGADSWVMTKLDVLTGFSELKVAVAYQYGGAQYDHWPSQLSNLEGLSVICESIPGWEEDITGVRQYGDLPGACRSYIERLEELVGTPVELLSVGPERDQVISRQLQP